MWFVGLSMNLSWPKMHFFPSSNDSNSLRIKWSAITLYPPEKQAHLIRLYCFFSPISYWHTHTLIDSFLLCLPACHGGCGREKTSVCRFSTLPREAAARPTKQTSFAWKGLVNISVISLLVSSHPAEACAQALLNDVCKLTVRCFRYPCVEVICYFHCATVE